MIKIALILILFSIAILTINAQPKSIGLKVGLNQNRFVNIKPNSIIPNLIGTGIMILPHIGIYDRIVINKRINILLELALSMKGAYFFYNVSKLDKKTGKNIFHYISVPLSISYRFNTISLELGLNPLYKLKDSFKDGSSGKYFRNYNYDVDALFGLSFNEVGSKISFTLRYLHGLLPFGFYSISKNGIIEKKYNPGKNQTIQLSFSYDILSS